MLKKFALIPYSTYLQSFHDKGPKYTKIPDNDMDSEDNSEDHTKDKDSIYKPQQNTKGHTVYLNHRPSGEPPDTRLMPPPGKGDILAVEKSTSPERSSSPDSSARTRGDVIPKPASREIETKLVKKRVRALAADQDADIDVVGGVIDSTDNPVKPERPSGTRKVKTDSGVIEVKTRSGRVSRNRRPYWLDG